MERTMELKLEDIFREYPESLKSAHILRSYLTDLFPHEEKLKINLIVNAYEQNVVREIEKAEELDSYIEKLLCSRLISNYGITSDNAEWAVDYWFLAYGKKVLHKSASVLMREMKAEDCTETKQEQNRKMGEKTEKKTTEKWMNTATQISLQGQKTQNQGVRLDLIYQNACEAEANGEYIRARELFGRLGDYKDSMSRLQRCLKEQHSRKRKQKTGTKKTKTRKNTVV